MKIKRLSHPKRNMVLILLTLFIVIAVGYVVNKISSEKEITISSAPTLLKSGSAPTTKDDEVQQAANTNSLTQVTPDVTPSVLIKKFSITSSPGTLSYTADVSNSSPTKECILVVSNEVGKQYSVTTQSNTQGCEGKLENEAFLPGSSWSVTLQYKANSITAAAKKAIVIQ